MSCETILREGLAALAIDLDDQAVTRLCRYFAELAKWSKKMNLVARGDDRTIIETHFLDSLTMLPLLRRQPADHRLLDIGSGAGFPGLALKCARPELPTTLAEPRQKRVSFLKHVIRTLQLPGIEVLPERIEPDHPAQAQYPLITSRAFADIPAFLAACEPLSPPGGLVICMKGPKYEEEIAAWRNSPLADRFRLGAIETHRLPFSGKERYLVIFAKQG
ncbi:MAG: 16S rRNA (guanine(527)-N(7))-methyltransferase RsmG [Desulfobulbaceae bacterium]|nr:16S rRNA (guanine(527)-N(7))-methyltransferase RsmG [Desulfobulbaceae bacterium]